MWKTIVRIGAGADVVWATYGYVSRLIWESGEVIGGLEISSRLAQELYLLAAMLGAATLLALSWKAIKLPLYYWWFADHIAREEKIARLRTALEQFAYNGDRAAELIYLGGILAEFGWKLDLSHNERARYTSRTCC